MAFQIILLIIGFAVLIKGADWLVDGASELARKYKVSDLAIGLTVVAFGTSAPELVVNVFAAYQGHHDIVFGNIIGSNNFNLFMILGIAGLIFPLSVQSSTVWKEIPFSFAAAGILFLLTSALIFPGNEILSRIDGVILLVMFCLFLFYVYKQLGNDTAKDHLAQKNLTVFKIWGFIIGGLTGLVLGGKLVVASSIDIAETLGISQKIIGLTIVAAGTSLPELATSVVAAMKKNDDIAVGNIIGSNIFNIFLILGVSSIINPVNYSADFDTDLLLLGLGTVFLFIAMFTGKKGKLDRWEAAVLLSVYTAYTTYIVMKEL